MPSSAPWLPYDPTWLVELAQLRFPRKKWLRKALAECTTAQMKTCCLPKVCGYYFVDASRPNRPGSPWRYKTSIWLDGKPDGPPIGLSILIGGRVGGFAYPPGWFPEERLGR